VSASRRFNGQFAYNNRGSLAIDMHEQHDPRISHRSFRIRSPFESTPRQYNAKRNEKKRLQSKAQLTDSGNLDLSNSQFLAKFEKKDGYKLARTHRTLRNSLKSSIKEEDEEDGQVEVEKRGNPLSAAANAVNNLDRFQNNK